MFGTLHDAKVGYQLFTKGSLRLSGVAHETCLELYTPYPLPFETIGLCCRFGRLV